MDEAINLYTEPKYCELTLQHLSYVAELRTRYKDLTFFDSVHAALTIIEELTYMDLDPVVREVVESEKQPREEGL